MNLVYGTLDMLILRTLEPGAMHGWAISQRIQQVSEDVLRVNQGSLYPALHRLERQRWISAKWADAESGHQAKFYELTAAGRKRLAAETEEWARLSTAVLRVIESA